MSPSLACLLLHLVCVAAGVALLWVVGAVTLGDGPMSQLAPPLKLSWIALAATFYYLYARAFWRTR